MAGVEWHVILKVIHVLFHFFKTSESRQNEILNQTRQTWLDWKQLLKAVNPQIHFFLNILFFLGDDKVLGYFWCAVITSTNEIIQQKRFNFTFFVGENPWHELGKVLNSWWERPIKTKKNRRRTDSYSYCHQVSLIREIRDLQTGHWTIGINISSHQQFNDDRP